MTSTVKFRRLGPAFVTALAVATGLLSGAQPAAPGLIKSEPIFDHGPFAQCHASTIVEVPDGLLAACWGGSKEGNPDVDVWTMRYSDGKWAAAVDVASGAETEVPRVAAYQPVLFQVPGGPLLLFYKTGKWWGYVKRSTDGGRTWSAPERLPNAIFGPVRSTPVVLADGSILSGSSFEIASATSGGWRVHFERSIDGGKSWQFIGPVNDGAAIAAIQPTILTHDRNRVQALGRTKQGKIFEIWSLDGGKTWGEMTLTELPNPNSGIAAVTLRDGRHLLVYNHRGVIAGTSKGVRAPLNVALSLDGKKWQAALVLEPDPGPPDAEPGSENQFSYPAVIQTRDGLIHVTYTWHRTHIQHVIIDPTKFVLRDIVGGQWPQQ